MIRFVLGAGTEGRRGGEGDLLGQPVESSIGREREVHDGPHAAGDRLAQPQEIGRAVPCGRTLDALHLEIAGIEMAHVDAAVREHQVGRTRAFLRALVLAVAAAIHVADGDSGRIEQWLDGELGHD